MFLQKVLALFYLIPIYLFYLIKYKKRSYNPLIMITSSYLIVLLIVGYSNYKRFGVNAFEFSKNFKWNKIVKKYLELI